MGAIDVSVSVAKTTRPHQKSSQTRKISEVIVATPKTPWEGPVLGAQIVKSALNPIAVD
jgi:hypothetical protein